MELEARKLTKQYGKLTALNRFSYIFNPGIYGLLGPNGAGKSTLINLITGNLVPSGGELFLEGKKINDYGMEYFSKIGFMPQQQQMPSGFTLRSFLFYVAGLKNLKKYEAEKTISVLAHEVNLEDSLDKKLTSFSGGMKQRAMLAQALMGKPEILILDEPTAGLDPMERIRFRNLVSKAAFNKIVIIATHVVSDIQYIANEVIVMNKGEITDSGAPWELCQSVNGKVFELTVDEADVINVEKKFVIADMIKDKDKVRIRVVSNCQPFGYKYTEQLPTLEDVYLIKCDHESEEK